MPDKICKVHCEAVDNKLEKIWTAIGKKVSFLVFSLVLGGLLVIAVFFGETISRRQDKTFDTLINIQQSVSGIQGELKHLNGLNRKDGR